MTEKPANADSGHRVIDDSVRGTRVGFLILTVLIVFVAYWMFVQGQTALLTQTETPVLPASQLDGFRADLWQLPDEPLLGFVAIPAGQFLMGSNPAFDRQAYENERWSETQRQGRVELALFYLGRYEVTVAQYHAFIQASGHPAVEQTLAAEADHPVSSITWTDALAYCRWIEESLSNSSATPTQLKDLLAQGWHISLPSEAQWEKAARGNDGAIYPWGTRILDNQANYDSGSKQAVGSYDCPDCNYGLSDMSGNVWELTRSPFQPYPYSPDDDRMNLTEDALWVMRGGSFSDGAENIRSAVRGGVDPGVRNNTIGFRIALTQQ